jgi:glutaredoxin 3
MIEIYSKPNCPYCETTKSTLKNQGVHFYEYVVGMDIPREEFFQKFPNARTVPQIVINGHHVGGYADLTEWMKTNDLRNVLSS